MDDHGTPENESCAPSPAVKRPAKPQLEQALAAFQQVIDRVKAGATDPDQLALSSLGQQARTQLWLGNIAPAAQLYARQAAQGGQPAKTCRRQWAGVVAARQDGVT